MISILVAVHVVSGFKSNDLKQRLNKRHLRQMQPLSIQQAAELDDVICISAMGTVTSINIEDASFIMHLTQYVSGGEIPHEIAVRAELANDCPDLQVRAK